MNHTAKKLQLFEVAQLELPFLSKNKKESKGNVISLEQKPTWSENDISELRISILFDGIHTLSDRRCSYQTRTELFEWIFNDEIQPFSFLVCCHAADYDPNRLRKSLKRFLKKEKIYIAV